MFSAIANFFKRLFGAAETQEARVKRLATAAGILVAANNPGKTVLISGMLRGISATIDKDQDKKAANDSVNQALAGLLKDCTAEEKAALVVLFGELNYSAATGTINADLPLLKALVEGFLSGIGA
jgi:hypothetical protein